MSKRVILAIETKMGEVITVGERFDGLMRAIVSQEALTVIDIRTSIGGLAGVNTGAPNAFCYVVTSEREDDTKITSVIPFDEVRAIHFQDIVEKKEEEEIPTPEAI